MESEFRKFLRLFTKLYKGLISLSDNLYNRSQLRAYRVTGGEGLKIKGRLLIRGRKNSITIGNSVSINTRFSANPIGGTEQASFWTIGKGTITIGDDTGISNSAFVSFDSIRIGSHVQIGGGCKIYDTDFHSLNYEERISSPDPGIVSRPVVICDGAFIGAHSIILKGVTIGERSVVGAGSVVTKSIPDGEIWAGNPARFIRKLETRAPEGRSEA
jgi:acetyltransferase-like isoleucine patch superfamily enzyme